MPPKERKLSTQSRRWHPQVVQAATCPVRELSSPRVVQYASWQSARWRIRELSSNLWHHPNFCVKRMTRITQTTVCTPRHGHFSRETRLASCTTTLLTSVFNTRTNGNKWHRFFEVCMLFLLTKQQYQSKSLTTC